MSSDAHGLVVWVGAIVGVCVGGGGCLVHPIGFMMALNEKDAMYCCTLGQKVALVVVRHAQVCASGVRGTIGGYPHPMVPPWGWG